MTAPVRVLVADDQTMIREGLRMILDAQPDIEVVAEAGDGAAALREAALHRPDVVLMDIRMPGMDGLRATERLLRSGSDARVLVLTTFGHDEFLYAAMRAGASGFLLKDSPRAQLVHAVRTVADGASLLDPVLTRRLIEDWVRRPPPSAGTPEVLRRLTPRELEVFTAPGARALQLRDRRRARALGDDGEEPRGARARQARAARPGAGGRARLRVRAGPPGWSPAVVTVRDGAGVTDRQRSARPG